MIARISLDCRWFAFAGLSFASLLLLSCCYTMYCKAMFTRDVFLKCNTRFISALRRIESFTTAIRMRKVFGFLLQYTKQHDNGDDLSLFRLRGAIHECSFALVSAVQLMSIFQTSVVNFNHNPIQIIIDIDRLIGKFTHTILWTSHLHFLVKMNWL